MRIIIRIGILLFCFNKIIIPLRFGSEIKLKSVLVNSPPPEIIHHNGLTYQDADWTAWSLLWTCHGKRPLKMRNLLGTEKWPSHDNGYRYAELGGHSQNLVLPLFASCRATHLLCIELIRSLDFSGSLKLLDTGRRWNTPSYGFIQSILNMLNGWCVISSFLELCAEHGAVHDMLQHELMVLDVWHSNRPQDLCAFKLPSIKCIFMCSLKPMEYFVGNFEISKQLTHTMTYLLSAMFLVQQNPGFISDGNTSSTKLGVRSGPQSVFCYFFQYYLLLFPV